ncbi:hypothetical protein J7E24_00825 [Hymenobacter sp. ISL-91]|uniref:hypothetical protein n=1 Tax=Hymenobacter sp. ISL-91 TaxID=2819151 RepID=UPI001BE61A72|nr:hypothetical protein [Hymenobacter sp. ISL-91]MBT2556318.1 hypothetical protein [Hymenobacter sp. ISL-91]
MKRLLFAACLSLALGACQKEEQATPAVIEYADWYALQSPDDRPIEAVTGDLDGTLTITTRFIVYQTKDRGRTWQTGNYADKIGIFGFYKRQDSLLVLTTGLGASSNTGTKYAAHPSAFSLDQGLTWQHYRDWRPSHQLRVGLDRVLASSGTEYRIEYEEKPTYPNSSSRYVESVAIQTSTGQRLTLPQQHQMTSLYFDANSRLYITASAPLCGRWQDSKVCGSQRGFLYVSKAPLR